MSVSVSVCVPNLNARRFLPERFETIFQQTLEDWELIVCDGYSDDGSWEYIQELAAREPRMQISQTPRQGIYAGFNDCIRQAQGEFVYVATSDDTMAPDCLEKLAIALERNPGCGLAHCLLKTIDSTGMEVDFGWERNSVFARGTEEFVNRAHVRTAPFDGFLHLSGESVYISITQLLIRRSLFDQIGLFETRWGSMADFHWNMRACLQTSTVHVPDTWGGWRIHSTQATDLRGKASPAYRKVVSQMIDDVVTASADVLSSELEAIVRGPKKKYFIDLLDLQLARHWSRLKFFAYLCASLLRGSRPAWEYCFRRLCGKPHSEVQPAKVVLAWLASAGIECPLQKL